MTLPLSPVQKHSLTKTKIGDYGHKSSDRKVFKRLTRQDTEHVFSKRVPVYAMTRKTHQDTEQAYWQWGILPGEGMSLSKFQNYPIRVLHRLARSGFWFEKCLIYACLIEKFTFVIYEYYK
jgi:hypothetical protein